ncbi:unnamed protein product [Effrenium voratum]|uniref:Pentatricopeptide repeat-containing protein, chloroplastic n=1 Tax=Effrenium voratum TaxID=2562239 RepID=A0AA36NH99_9DINO|nr:unnamed protein product [Effrenium voratum]
MGPWRLSTALLGAMRATAVEADAFCGTALLSALRSWQRGLALHAAQVTASNRFTMNAAMSLCEKAGQWRTTLALLGIDPDTISFNTAISACEWCWSLHFLEANSGATPITYNSAMQALAKGSQWDKALGLLEELCGRRWQPTPVTISTAIMACERGSQWQQALTLATKDLQLITASGAISACEKAGRWQHALKLFWDLLAAKLRVDVIAFNAAISASPWTNALQLLASLCHCNLQATMVSQSAVGTSCAAGRHWRRALLFSRRSLVGTRNMALSACESTGHWQQALPMFQAMRSEALEQSLISWNTCTSGLAQEQWQAALQLLNQVEDCKVQGNLITHNAAMSAWELRIGPEPCNF